MSYFYLPIPYLQDLFLLAFLLYFLHHFRLLYLTCPACFNPKAGCRVGRQPNPFRHPHHQIFFHLLRHFLIFHLLHCHRRNHFPFRSRFFYPLRPHFFIYLFLLFTILLLIHNF